MKKRFFISLGVLSLFALGGASLMAKHQVVNKAKADVDVVLNFNSLNNNNTNKNIIDIACTPENDIPTGWDEGVITQVTRNAFLINNAPTQDDGNCVIHKLQPYRYQVCVDSIKWSKYHDLIQENDVVIVQGQWIHESNEITYNVTIPTFAVKWNGESWEKTMSYDIGTIELSVNEDSHSDPDEVDFVATVENAMDYSSDSSKKMEQTEGSLLINGEDTYDVGTCNLIKLSKFRYVFDISSIGAPYNVRNVGDRVAVQGDWKFDSHIVVMTLHISPISVTWDGTNWVLTSVYEQQQIDAVEALINAIGEVSLEKEEAITAAKNAYYALSDEGRAKINPTKVEALETAILTFEKLKAKDELENYKDPSEYRTAEQSQLATIVSEGKAAIETATDVDGVKAALANAKSQADALKTDTQYIEDEAALQSAKTSAKAELEGYKNAADYRETEATQLATIVSNGKAAIEAATDVDGVASALADAKALADALKTKAEYEAEEAANALVQAKASAKAELEGYKNPSDYRPAEQTELATIVLNGKSAIDSATTVQGVESALSGAKALADALKTKAEYEADEVQPEPEQEESAPAKKGCGGSVLAASALISCLSLAGFGLLLSKKRR